MRNLIGVMTAATLLVGCTAYAPIDPFTSSNALLEKAKSTQGAVTLKASFVAGGYATAAAVPVFTKDAVHHVRIALFQLEGMTEVPLKDEAGAPVVKNFSVAELETGAKLQALKVGQSYRARATAYSSAASAISGEAASDFKVEVADVLAEASLQIKLSDVLFNGEATASGIVVTPGDVLHDGPVSMN